MSDSVNFFVVQSILAVSLLGISLLLIRLNKSTMLERRFKEFCTKPINDTTESFSTKIKNRYIRFRNRLSKSLIKFKFLDEYSKKYQKYSDKTKIIREDLMNYISDKIVCGLLFVFIIIISDILRYKFITFMQFLLAFLIGFFLPDIYLKIRDRYRLKQIEKDMLKAIIIMNNSFKSGLSIMQAIFIVSKELDGPISEEFKKMYIDISFGLNMDLVFQRFADRVNTDDARYITTSLSVLNKTGGNIVQVFSSVEKSAFTRKKLKEELGALSATANAMFKILSIMPIVLIVIVFILNPAYFSPLFKTGVGIVISCIILIIYISYLLIIKKIISVKE